jgi:hypothetical protein
LYCSVSPATPKANAALHRYMQIAAEEARRGELQARLSAVRGVGHGAEVDTARLQETLDALRRDDDVCGAGNDTQV